MRRLRRSNYSWLISQALCFCLLLQGTGIAQALPLPPTRTFVSQAEFEAALAGPSPESRQASPVGDGFLEHLTAKAWSSVQGACIALVMRSAAWIQRTSQTVGGQNG